MATSAPTRPDTGASSDAARGPSTRTSPTPLGACAAAVDAANTNAALKSELRIPGTIRPFPFPFPFSVPYSSFQFPIVPQTWAHAFGSVPGAQSL